MPKAAVRANARSLTEAKPSMPAAKARCEPSVEKPRRPSSTRISSTWKPSAKSAAALQREAAKFAAGYPITQAVDAHSRAHQRFERAVDATDDTAAKREGRAVTDADEAEWNEAALADARALRRLVRTRPTTVEGLRALIGYSVSCFRDQGWDEATLSQLLTSVMESAPLRLR